MAGARALLEAMDGIALVLNSRLRIVNMGRANWAAFWRANGGAADAPEVLGQEITDHFSEGPVRTTFRAALAGVLSGERARLRLPFRCDAPALRRDMQLSVTRLGVRHLLYHAVEIARRPRTLGTAGPQARWGAVCAICARAARAGDEAELLAALDWPTPPEAVPQPLIRSAREVCPRCQLALLGQAA